jgi:hypothetical protein
MMFDSYTTMTNVTFLNSTKTSSMDYCRTLLNNVKDVYITDLDGNLKPTSLMGSVIKTPATVVSLQSGMLQFLDTTKCTNVPSECLSYCQDTCFRGIVFEVDPSFTENFTMTICAKTNPSNCVISPGRRRTDNKLLEDDSRYFAAYVPLGEYTAIFKDEFGQESFPSFARKLITDVTCPNIANHDVELREPPVTYSNCFELIRNGNIDMSPVTPTYWLAQGRGLGLMQLLPFGGIMGTNALASVNPGRTIFVQFLDTRCLRLMVGAEYTLSAQIKLINPATGQPVPCNRTKESCPEIGIFTDDSGFQVASKFINEGHLSTFFQFNHEYNVLASMNASGQYDDYIDTMGVYKVVATAMKASSSFSSNNIGFQTVTGKFRILNELVQKTGIRFYIQSYKYQLVVDDVSMRLSNETAKPVTIAPAVAPAAFAPIATPVTFVPIAVPVTFVPIAVPVTFAPTATPVTFVPTAAPITFVPTAAPITFVPTAAPVPIDNTSCTNIVANSDMELGFLGYWTAAKGDRITKVQPGYQSKTALKYTKSRSRTGPRLITSMSSNFNLQCMTDSTTKWIISAHLRLIRKGTKGIGTTCILNESCPALVVIIRNKNGSILLKKKSRSYIATKWNANAFNLFQATIDLPTEPNWRNAIGDIAIGFGNYSPLWELIFDNFIVQPI